MVILAVRCQVATNMMLQSTALSKIASQRRGAFLPEVRAAADINLANVRSPWLKNRKDRTSILGQFVATIELCKPLQQTVGVSIRKPAIRACHFENLSMNRLMQRH